MPKKIDDKALENYANSVEGVPTAPTFDIPIPKEETPEDRLYNSRPEVIPSEEREAKVKEQVLTEIHSNGLGYLKHSMQNLPTHGLFNPEGTELFIRAATGNEIRHWSQTNETEYLEIDDAFGYMLERCLSVKMPGRVADYRDLTELDKLYLIFALRDFTFPDGNNELMVKISETKQIPLKKDNIDFVKFEDNIMRFYNPEKRCFTIQNFTAKNGKEINLKKPLNIYIPKIGVLKWIKEYVQRKQNANQGFEKDYITIAPLLIPDYRGLNDNTYEAYIASWEYFGVYEYSIIEQFKRVVSLNSNPKFKYIDEQGVEQQAPLTFQGGIKAIFLYGGMDDLI